MVGNAEVLRKIKTIRKFIVYQKERVDISEVYNEERRLREFNNHRTY